MDSPDSGVVNGLYYLFRRMYFESKRRGEQNDQMLMLMGGCLTVMDCAMSMKAFNRIKGGKGRSR